MTIEFIGMIHHRHASEIHPPAAVGAGSRLRPRLRAGRGGGELRSRAGGLFLGWAGWVSARRRGGRVHRAVGLPDRASAGFRGAHAGGAEIRHAGSDHRRTRGDPRDLRRRRCGPVARRRHAAEGRTLRAHRRIRAHPEAHLDRARGRWIMPGDTTGSSGPRRRCAACSSHAFRSISAARRMRRSRLPASMPMSTRCGARRMRRCGN